MLARFDLVLDDIGLDGLELDELEELDELGVRQLRLCQGTLTSRLRYAWSRADSVPPSWVLYLPTNLMFQCRVVKVPR